jgi:hypothetical protein
VHDLNEHSLPGGERECGSCTACCDGWLKIEIRGHQVRPGIKCPFSTANGCDIYQDRPEDPCRKFVCGWLAHRSPLPEWMRPDRSKVILLTASFSWRGIPVDAAVPAGENPEQAALAWLTEFYALRKKLLVYKTGDEWYAFGPPVFQHDIRARVQRGEELWSR